MATINCAGGQIGNHITIGSQLTNLTIGGTTVSPTPEPEGTLEVTGDVDQNISEQPTARQTTTSISYRFEFSVPGTFTNIMMNIGAIFVIPRGVSYRVDSVEVLIPREIGGYLRETLPINTFTFAEGSPGLLTAQTLSNGQLVNGQYVPIRPPGGAAQGGKWIYVVRTTASNCGQCNLNCGGDLPTDCNISYFYRTVNDVPKEGTFRLLTRPVILLTGSLTRTATGMIYELILENVGVDTITNFSCLLTTTPGVTWQWNPPTDWGIIGNQVVMVNGRFLPNTTLSLPLITGAAATPIACPPGEPCGEGRCRLTYDITGLRVIAGTRKYQVGSACLPIL